MEKCSQTGQSGTCVSTLLVESVLVAAGLKAAGEDGAQSAAGPSVPCRTGTEGDTCGQKLQNKTGSQSTKT